MTSPSQEEHNPFDTAGNKYGELKPVPNEPSDELPQVSSVCPGCGALITGVSSSFFCDKCKSKPSDTHKPDSGIGQEKQPTPAEDFATNEYMLSLGYKWTDKYGWWYSDNSAIEQKDARKLLADREAYADKRALEARIDTARRMYVAHTKSGTVETNPEVWVDADEVRLSLQQYIEELEAELAALTQQNGEQNDDK